MKIGLKALPVAGFGRCGLGKGATNGIGIVYRPVGYGVPAPLKRQIR